MEKLYGYATDVKKKKVFTGIMDGLLLCVVMLLVQKNIMILSKSSKHKRTPIKPTVESIGESK